MTRTTHVRACSTARRVAAAAAAVALTAGVAGCSGAAAAVDAHGAASFVIGARSNMPAPRLDGQALAVLNDAADNQSYVSIVVADGEPNLAGEKDLLIEGANDVAREQSRRDNRQEVEQGILGAQADDEEVDLLAALTWAARTIHSKNTTPSTIVVVDSGLSTAGPLDFTRDGMLDADPQDVVDSLTAQDALPDLTSIDVVWQGMGDTARPQESLSNGQRKNLQAIWAAVLGASDSGLRIEEHPLTDAGPGGLPAVTPIPMPDGPECTTTSVTVSAADVAFQPDSAEFLDEAAARSVLEPIAAQLTAAEGASVSLVGTTADVGPTGGQVEAEPATGSRGPRPPRRTRRAAEQHDVPTASAAPSRATSRTATPTAASIPVPRRRTARSSSRRRAPASSSARDLREAPRAPTPLE